MITLLSIILPLLSFIIIFIMSIFHYNFWLSLLFGFIGWCIVFISICILILILLIINGKRFSKLDDHNNQKCWDFMNDVSHFSVLWMGIKVHTKGLDKLNPNDTYVFYSNHQGFAEVILYDCLLKEYKRGSMYKVEHEKNILISGMVKALGGVSIDRNDDRHSAMAVLEIIKRVRTGNHFLIYPEGTRSKSPKMGPYHPGSFKIVQKSGAKLVNIIIDGSYKWTCYVPFIPCHVYVEIVNVYNNEDIKDMNSVDLCNKIQNEAQEALDLARTQAWYLKNRRR